MKCTLASEASSAPMADWGSGSETKWRRRTLLASAQQFLSAVDLLLTQTPCCANGTNAEEGCLEVPCAVEEDSTGWSTTAKPRTTEIVVGAGGWPKAEADDVAGDDRGSRVPCSTCSSTMEAIQGDMKGMLDENFAVEYDYITKDEENKNTKINALQHT
jgi:hypothetical protein